MTKTYVPTELESLITNEFQSPIERITHNLNVKRQMGTAEFELRNQINNLDRLKVEYQEVLDYVEPLLKAKREDEKRTNQKLKDWAASHGGTLHYSSSGYPQITVPRQTLVIQRGT